MKRYRTALRRGRGEQGQVLILAVVALILVIIAVLLLFDVQTVIRGKLKGQNAVDAAALTGAEWQKHSLNLIGELNLVRATGTLISDPYFESAVMETYRNAEEFFFDTGAPIRNHSDDFLKFPELESLVIRDENDEIVGLKGGLLLQEVFRVEKERFYLDSLDRLVSQLQTRVAFAGPLIGFGAAQQAAKNNGLSFDPDASELFIIYANLVAGTEHDIYDRFTPKTINDFEWRNPYLFMLESILDSSMAHDDLTGNTDQRAYGIAAGTRFKFTGMPMLAADPPSDFTNLLGNKQFYEDILGRNWCELDPFLYLDFGGNWWGSFQCDFESSFSRQAEILPLHITFSYFSPEDSNMRNPYGKPADIFDEASDALQRYARGDGLLSRTFRDKTNPYEHGFRHTYEEIPSTPGEKKETRVTIKTSPFSPFPDEETEDGPDERSDLEKINTWDIITGNGDTVFTPEQVRLFLDTFLKTYNDGDTDHRYSPLPILSWALYDQNWTRLGDNTKQAWEGYYLQGDFKPGMDYHSGAVSFFEAQQDTVTISGSMGRPRRGNRAQDVGQVFSNTAARHDAAGVSANLGRLDYAVEKIRTNASAKPVGRIRTDDGQYLCPFEAGRMVLPVFTETALTPISLDKVEGISMLDIDWFYYLTEFVPLLSGSPSLQNAWDRAATQYPRHLRYFKKYYDALVLIGDPGFRQMGINWLETPVVWEKDANGNRYPVGYNRDVNCIYGNDPDAPETPLH